VTGRPVFLVDGTRTPFIKARGRPGPFTPVDLAVQCGRPLLLRQSFPRRAFDMVILGCVNVLADEMNPARIAALRLGLGSRVPAFTVQNNCGSGMLSIDSAFRRIQTGSADLVLAGGAEALSHAPLVLRREAADWFGRFAGAKTVWDKTRLVADLRPDYLKPVIGLERGLTDPVVQMNMGQTAENVGHLLDISRSEADAYAVESHRRLARAQSEGWLDDEVAPMVAPDGTLYDHDDGVRPDSSADRLAGLKPVFEPPFGKVTAGNSSQITDGAAWVILASEKAVEGYGLEPKARIVDCDWAALDPAVMGLGPTLAVTALLRRLGLGREDIDLWELNEAFAAQVLACLAAWRDPDYCARVLGLDQPFGEIEPDRLNVDGGAISLGHPVGTSGNRIVLHLANAMRRLHLRRGVATECIGGGQAGAMLLETV
jgi:acetyl-CoA C-acetyltransferase